MGIFCKNCNKELTENESPCLACSCPDRVCKIECAPAFINVNPSGFYKYAKDFFDAGENYKKSKNFSPVPYYLYCRSIELVLKSFLLDKGISKKDLKDNYGHNLIKLLSKIKKWFDVKPLSDSEENVIKVADNYYSDKNKGFEYFEVSRAVIGYSDLPDLLQLENISRELLVILKVKIN